MMMRMLAAGGVEVLTDGVRAPDVANPRGYYELERVKDLATTRDLPWLAGARGKAVKIVSSLLKYLPAHHNYRVVFMNRDLHEIVASQDKMLAQRGEGAGTPDEAALVALNEQHLKQVKALLAHDTCFETLEVRYTDVLTAPLDQARRVRSFLRRRLDVEAMAAVADPSLYRSRGVRS